MRRYITALLCLFAVAFCAPEASAEEIQARDISAETQYTSVSYVVTGFLKDQNTDYYVYSEGNADITLENPAGMASLYLRLDYEYGEYTVTDNTTGKSFTAGKNNYIHEYIDLVAELGCMPTSVTLNFNNGTVAISELYVFSEGEVPDFVQRWEPPLDGCADILMMPTHSDDDQLYFAGITPYYAGELDCAVQVVYFTNHRIKNTVRMHEMLDGLWATGVENYPLFGFDFDFRVDYMEATYARITKDIGIPMEELESFVVEMFRRFKPQVVVAHDINGEYGHGMHKVYADLVMRCVDGSKDPAVFPELAQKYGVWDVPKTYLHLWEENPIVLPIDVPLESFGGLTAFQVAQQIGFPCHKSQQKYVDFPNWLYGFDREITSSTQIELYNPAYFGLYRTTIGPDVNKNDFLENITTYAQQARLEAERLEAERLEAERLEQERLEQERLEQERLEQERLEQERLEAERLEAERLEQERLEAERLEQERLAQEALDEKPGFAGVLMVLIPAVMLFFSFRFGMGMAKKRYKQNPVSDRLEQNRKLKK